ncbi:MAG: PAS domain-containing sensor histidine kinase, partial [Deltaproteobacteria bacterium]|nr:PAS domain-containing sensor histidine kinase [Deltaproteobacteria bacterium]
MPEKHTSHKPRSGQNNVDEQMFLFRDLAEKSLGGIYLIQDKLFRYTNKRMGQIFGYSVEEIIDRIGPERLVYSEDWPIVGGNINRRIAGKLGSIHYEFRGVKKDGGIIDIEAYGYATTYNGRPAVIGTLIDITKKKQSDLMLKQAEQLYRGIFENAIEGIFQTTVDGRMIASNPALATMLGYSSPEEYIASVSDLKSQHYVNPDHRQIFIDTVEREGIARGFECQLYKKNGDILWVVMNARAVRNPDGSTQYYEGTIEDVTEQKKAADKLRTLNEFNEAIIENAPVAIFTLDKKGRFTSVNPALARLSGLGDRAAEKLLGFNWLTNPFTIKSGLAKHIRKGLKGEPFQLWDFPFITYRGDRSIYMDFKGVPLRGRSGVIDGLLCIIEETTDRVKTRAKLMQDTKISAIGRLAAGAAHELNNPLATLVAFTEIAAGMVESYRQDNASPLDAGQLSYCLDIVQQQAFRCKNVINDLLSLSRKDGLEIVDVDVNNLIGIIVESVNFSARGITIESELLPSLPFARADLSALRQVIVNLVHNAMDAVEGRMDATIWVRTYLDKDMLNIEVSDNGVGIPGTI